MSFQSSELVLNEKGQVYHLGLFPNQISHKIILVGDQQRVKLISSEFEEITHETQTREFACATGRYKGKHISVLSTGIGTDNIDIVMNELDALVNIDLNERKVKENKTILELVRIGTCGLLHANLPLHTYVLSSAAIGLDNVAHFYDLKKTNRELAGETELKTKIRFPEKVIPYFIESDTSLTNRLECELTEKGITVTASGFYGPQGRSLRLPLRSHSMRDDLENTEISGERVLNFEMESSALFALSRALGHKATTICLGIANRPAGKFSEDYKKDMQELIRYVLARI
jgi:uridine phosphorylase